MQKITLEMLYDVVLGIKKNQDKLVLEVVGLKEGYGDLASRMINVESDTRYIKSVVEKDAKKQGDHEIEHLANVAAHDRFEKRIKVLEGAKK